MPSLLANLFSYDAKSVEETRPKRKMELHSYHQKAGNQVENLVQSLDFGTGVDHMNQVMSFDRLVYFGYIFEESGLLGHN